MIKEDQLSTEDLKKILLSGNYVSEADMAKAEDSVEKNGGDLVSFSSMKA